MRHCIIAVLASLLSLGARVEAQDDVNRAAVEASLDSLMRAYAAAFEARDADRVIAFYAPGSATFGWNDGRPTAYDAYVSGLRGFIRSIGAVAIQYETIKAHAITNDVGAVRTTLRETWTDAGGRTTAVRVFVSWVARKTNGQWRLVYFDGRHESVAADSTRNRPGT